MNIKSLLLGSAAALVAVSGARAADAIVAAEPEPVEYVRVCDAFGTGYFYIPGTETCLRIGGYVRTDIHSGIPYTQMAGNNGNTYNIRTRASVRFYTASETELGALRTYVETRFQWDTNTAAAAVAPGYTNANEWNLNHAWIQLGGLRIGMGDSFFTTWTGYAGSVVNDWAPIPYGLFSTNFISYTYTGGAFRAGIALEQGASSDAGTVGQWGIDDYMPHVVVGAGATFGMVDLSGVLAWDSRNGATVGGWAGKVRADVKFNDAASAFLMVMYGQNTSAYTPWRTVGTNTNTFAVIGGGSYAFTDKATFNMQAGWAQVGGAADNWHLTGNVRYALVPGLTITPEVSYVKTGGAGSFGGGVRVERSF